jgi:hypothetical protein
MTFIVPGLVLVINEASGGAAEIHTHLLWLSPLAAVLSGAGEAATAVLDIAPAVMSRALVPPPIPAYLRGIVGAAWVPSVAIWLVAAGFCWYAAGMAIDPCHPARRWVRGSAAGSGPRFAGRVHAQPREAEA